MRKPILEFQGEYRFLSNFWPALIDYEGITYPSVEHAYQAAKTLDQDTRLVIAATDTPGKTKRLGGGVTLRPNWDFIKRQVMKDLLLIKFRKDGPLHNWLMCTRDEEGNYWGDTYWGVCKGVGMNWLGKLLMEVREELRG